MMATIFKAQLLNAFMVSWWIACCIIGIGLPSLVDARYLPTRRSKPTNEGFDRLRELLRDILESDPSSLTSSPSVPDYSDHEQPIKRKSNDMPFSPPLTFNKMHAKNDDFDLENNGDRKDFDDEKQQVEQDQLLRFILLNFGAKHPKPPLKQSQDYASNQQAVVTRSHRPNPKSHRSKQISIDEKNSGLVDNLDWINNNDYDMLNDDRNEQKTFPKFRYRRNSSNSGILMKLAMNKLHPYENTNKKYHLTHPFLNEPNKIMSLHYIP